MCACANERLRDGIMCVPSIHYAVFTLALTRGMAVYTREQGVSGKASLLLVAERLSARQLILLSISFCVDMYVYYMYVCPSRLEMLISLHCARVLI